MAKISFRTSSTDIGLLGHTYTRPPSRSQHSSVNITKASFAFIDELQSVQIIGPNVYNSALLFVTGRAYWNNGSVVVTMLIDAMASLHNKDKMINK